MDVEPALSDISEWGSDGIPQGANPTVLQEQGNLQQKNAYL